MPTWEDPSLKKRTDQVQKKGEIGKPCKPDHQTDRREPAPTPEIVINLHLLPEEGYTCDHYNLPVTFLFVVASPFCPFPTLIKDQLVA